VKKFHVLDHFDGLALQELLFFLLWLLVFSTSRAGGTALWVNGQLYSEDGLA